MRSSSVNFSPTLQASHTVASTVSPFYNGSAVLDAVPISDGTVTWDSSQLVQGSLSVTVPRYYTPADGVRRDLLPLGDTDAFGCNGQRLALAYTIGRPGGFSETVNLGWFRISDWAEDGANINVNATSLEALLDEYRLIGIYQLAAGTTVQAAVRSLVAGVLPIRFVNVSGNTAGKSYEDNRLDAINQVITNFGGYVMRINDAGTLEIRPGPDDTNDPAVGSLTDGSFGTVVQSPNQGSRDGIYNAVNASGEADTGATSPVSVTVHQQTGPRAWNGPYGNVPYFFASPQLKTVAAAKAAATTRLRNLQATARPVAVDAVPDPRYVLNDLLTVSYQGRSLYMRVDAITLPLTAGGGAMTMTGHAITRS